LYPPRALVIAPIIIEQNLPIYIALQLTITYFISNTILQ
jgi:hypothetical protein